MTAMSRKQAAAARPQKGKLVVLAVLVSTAVVIAVVQMPAASPAAAPADKPQVITTAKPMAVAAVGMHREPVDLTVHWPVEIRQDLFEQERIVQAVARPQEKPDAAAITAHARQTLRLQAIMLDQQPRALINGQLCKPGSMIHGYELQRIAVRQVTVVRDGVTVQLGL